MTRPWAALHMQVQACKCIDVQVQYCMPWNSKIIHGQVQLDLIASKWPSVLRLVASSFSGTSWLHPVENVCGL